MSLNCYRALLHNISSLSSADRVFFQINAQPINQEIFETVGVPERNSLSGEQIVLYAKLFFLMGFSWMSDGIHVEVHGHHIDIGEYNMTLEVILFY